MACLGLVKEGMRDGDGLAWGGVVQELVTSWGVGPRQRAGDGRQAGHCQQLPAVAQVVARAIRTLREEGFWPEPAGEAA